MAQKFVEKKAEKQLKEDLEKYRRRAIELGATDAKVITTDDVIVDERVLAKCTYPKCESYGTSMNCPPNAMSPELMRKVVNKFRYAIFIKMEVPPETMVGPAIKDPNISSPYRRKIAEIVARIESEAFYDGYHMAVGFGGGSCKIFLCPDQDCSGLNAGKGCRYSLIARSSMEAVGMDAYTMATGVGWEIYPMGKATSPSEIPYGLRLGLILMD